MDSTANAEYLRLPLLLLLLCLLSACATAEAPGEMATEDGAGAMQYDMNSWQSMIDEQCRSFFDGCNNCIREPGKAGACTMKACATYQRPRCLDEVAQSGEPMAPKRVQYVCDGGSRFSVSYREYVQDDQRLRLRDDEVMLSDRQTHTAYRLQRERSASGEKYTDSAGLQFFARGDEAMVIRQGEKLYSNCLQQP